jgi:excisionase family DNA binding protein
MTHEVARRLSLSADRVRQLARAGEIDHVRVGFGVRLFPAREVERFARERAQQAKSRGDR